MDTYKLQCNWGDWDATSREWLVGWVVVAAWISSGIEYFFLCFRIRIQALLLSYNDPNLRLQQETGECPWTTTSQWARSVINTGYRLRLQCMLFTITINRENRAISLPTKSLLSMYRSWPRKCLFPNVNRLVERKCEHIHTRVREKKGRHHWWSLFIAKQSMPFIPRIPAFVYLSNRMQKIFKRNLQMVDSRTFKSLISLHWKDPTARLKHDGDWPMLMIVSLSMIALYHSCQNFWVNPSWKKWTSKEMDWTFFIGLEGDLWYNMGLSLFRTPMPVNVASSAKINQMNTALRVQSYRPKGGVIK